MDDGALISLLEQLPVAAVLGDRRSGTVLGLNAAAGELFYGHGNADEADAKRPAVQSFCDRILARLNSDGSDLCRGGRATFIDTFVDRSIYIRARECQTVSGVRWMIVLQSLDDALRSLVAGGGDPLDERSSMPGHEAAGHRPRGDAVTGLADRREFDRRLASACADLDAERGDHFALLFIDLDRFKPVNDRFGHLVGDRVLRLMGDRVLCCVRPNDLAARVGGDEFGVLLQSVSQAEDAIRIAQRLCGHLAQPVTIAEGQAPFEVHCSVGIALSTQGFCEPEALFAAADRAMYAAKRAGGGYALAEPCGA